MSPVYGGEFPGLPMSDIKPALTPEDMGRKIHGVGVPDGSRHKGEEVNYIASQIRAGLSGEWYRAHAQVLNEVGELLKGFTREMVKELTALEAESHHPASAPYFGDVGFLLDIADLIKALLPPEKPDDLLAFVARDESVFSNYAEMTREAEDGEE